MKDVNIAPSFTADTKIITKKGLKNIEIITTKDYVLAVDGTYQRALRVVTEQPKDLYRLEVLFQPSTNVAGSQLYYAKRKTEDGYSYSEWIPAKDIAVGDLVMTYILDDNAPVWRPVKIIRQLDETQIAYSLEVENHSYTANGAVVYN